jgi:RNA polymerase sigma-70 factor (ECF subfamily)
MIRFEYAFKLACEAWPTVRLSPEEFFSYVEARLRGSEVVVTNDLYLACACVKGDRAAIDAFETAYSGVITSAIARFRLIHEERQDLLQELRVAFFAKRTLAGYSGRGALRGWVRSAAIRAGLDLVEGRGRGSYFGDDLADIPSTCDPELDALRKRFTHDFDAAFAGALAERSPIERLILAQYYIDRLTVDQLAAVHAVHRATAARWIGKLSQKLRSATKSRLVKRLRLDEPSLKNLFGIAGGDLDLSIARLLRTQVG